MRVLQGEASSADGVNIHIAHEMILKLLRGVSGHDTYNIDETSVNYRAQPSRTLASQPRSGIKLAKDRITAVLCVNATGTHKLPVMIIGSAKRPRCFPSGWEPRRDAKVWYTSNKSAWMERTIFAEYMSFFNDEMKNRGKTGWLFIDNSSTHCLPPDATSHVWEVDGLRLRGFKMSNTNAVFLPANTTSHIQPLDAGIIVNFKAKFRRLFICWIIFMLDSGIARDSEKARPNMYQAIQWARTAWDEVTPETMKNCWNKVKILPAPLVVAGGGATNDVWDKLRALLVSMGDECDVLTFVDQPNESWTEALVDSNEEDDEVVAVIRACNAQDVEDADDSTAVIPLTLSKPGLEVQR